MTPQMAIAITGKNYTKPAFDQVVADANRAATAVSSTGPRMAGAMSLAGTSTANLAAQFNDIGVMLASGQSPLLLAIQQGTQINQIFAGMKAADAVKALGTAFMSLINPLSLITIGSIAAGAALFQYLLGINTEGKSATEVVKEQNDAIRATAERWGDAVPALKAYVDQLDRAERVAEQKTAEEVFAADQFVKAATIIDGLNDSFDTLIAQLTAAGANEEQVSQLYNAFVNLKQEVEAGTASTEDYMAVTAAMAVLSEGHASIAISALAQQFGPLGEVVAQAARKIAEFHEQVVAASQLGPHADLMINNQDFVAEQERLTGLTAEQLALENEIARVKADAERSGATIGDDQARQLAERRLAAEALRDRVAEGARASTTVATAQERERLAVEDLIEQLEYEKTLIGLTNTEKAIQNALRQAGAEATEAERAQIAELITATEAEQAARQALSDQWEQYGQIGQMAVRGVVDALKDMKLEAGEVSDLMGSILDKSLDMALSGVFDAFESGGQGMNWLTSLFNGGTSLSTGVGGTSSITGSSGGYFPGFPSFAGGGSTGTGARAGGLDGQGGFMALLHPQETVVDHALGETSSRGPVKVTVINSGKPVEAEAHIARDGRGGLDISVVLEPMVTGIVNKGIAQGRFDSTANTVWGLKRKGH